MTADILPRVASPRPEIEAATMLVRTEGPARDSAPCDHRRHVIPPPGGPWGTRLVPARRNGARAPDMEKACHRADGGRRVMCGPPRGDKEGPVRGR